MIALIHVSLIQFYKGQHQPQTDWLKVVGLADVAFNYNLTKFQLIFRGAALDSAVNGGPPVPIFVRNLKVEICLGMLQSVFYGCNTNVQFVRIDTLIVSK